MKKLSKIIFLGLCCTLVIAGCKDQVMLPKPKGWSRIDLPNHEYEAWTSPSCPFSCEIPKFSRQDSLKDDSCWVDFYIEPFNCRWHITYRNVPESGKSRGQHLMEYHNLVYKHAQKSSRIIESPVVTKKGDGVFYELYGDVGVPAQFVFGDDDNLVMTSFYFNQAVNGDSLAPVIDFVKEDLHHMIQTIEWKN